MDACSCRILGFLYLRHLVEHLFAFGFNVSSDFCDCVWLSYLHMGRMRGGWEEEEEMGVSGMFFAFSLLHTNDK